MDPAFRQMAGSLAEVASSEGTAATPAIDPAAYMQAMQGMMSNPQFMQMAERLGTQMMQARAPLRRRRRASLGRYTQP
jgi:hypothetical protein